MMQLLLLDLTNLLHIVAIYLDGIIFISSAKKSTQIIACGKGCAPPNLAYDNLEYDIMEYTI